MLEGPFHPRFIRPRLSEALGDSPVVLVHGPRQCGKTTLARAVGDAAGFSYLSFDDDVLRASAQTDPMGFVADLPGKTVLDEIERVPALFTALKAAIDRDRKPGRFILTGSANVLLLPKLADSLAGRMEIRGSCGYTVRLAQRLADWGVAATLISPDLKLLEPKVRQQLRAPHWMML